MTEMRPTRADVRFPQYLVDTHWVDSEGVAQYSSTHAMYRTIPLPGVVQTEAYAKFLKARPEVDRASVEIKVSFVGYETWCLGWFSHWTFDDGQSDAEFRCSFDEYVFRHERCQEWPMEARPEGWRCLMGAEDRWRWRAADAYEEGVPCRCEGCRKQGRVVINH